MNKVVVGRSPLVVGSNHLIADAAVRVSYGSGEITQLSIPVIPTGVRPSASDARTEWRNLLFPRALNCILAAVLFSVAVVAQELPKGWRRPTLTEAKGKWRNKSHARFLRVRGDFDGDGRQDVAELLVSSSAIKIGLFVRVSSQHNEWQSVHEPDGPLDRLGIAIVRPKKYVTLCSSDPSVCAANDPRSLDLKSSAINLFAYGANNSFLYWDPKAEKFQSAPMSD
jgi:hypothetical protein